ncbi:hypothetical protein OG225_01165 [Nocardia sp. NBC_01377]|uniref:hypothetical protein n=1 Tax=Nocardia sp. NBC_01377 TaxID=2903595 RepID=UPI0032448F36
MTETPLLHQNQRLQPRPQRIGHHLVFHPRSSVSYQIFSLCVGTDAFAVVFGCWMLDDELQTQRDALASAVRDLVSRV